MLNQIKEAVFFMDLKERMAGQCIVPDISELEAEFLVQQIRRNAR